MLSRTRRAYQLAYCKLWGIFKSKYASNVPDESNFLSLIHFNARTVDEICEEADKLVKKGVIKRFIRQTDQRAAIETLVVKLDHAWRLFNVSSPAPSLTQ
jgi:hypothetical protein